MILACEHDAGCDGKSPAHGIDIHQTARGMGQIRKTARQLLGPLARRSRAKPSNFTRGPPSAGGGAPRKPGLYRQSRAQIGDSTSARSLSFGDAGQRPIRGSGKKKALWDSAMNLLEVAQRVQSATLGPSSAPRKIERAPRLLVAEDLTVEISGRRGGDRFSRRGLWQAAHFFATAAPPFLERSGSAKVFSIFSARTGAVPPPWRRLPGRFLHGQIS